MNSITNNKQLEASSGQELCDQPGRQDKLSLFFSQIVIPGQKISPSLTHSLKKVDMSQLPIKVFVRTLEESFGIEIQWVSNREYLGDVTFHLYGESHNNTLCVALNSCAAGMIARENDVIYEENKTTQRLFCDRQYRNLHKLSPGGMLELAFLSSNVYFLGWDPVLLKEQLEIKYFDSSLTFLFQETSFLISGITKFGDKFCGEVLKEWFLDYLYKKINFIKNDLEELKKAIISLKENDGNKECLVKFYKEKAELMECAFSEYETFLQYTKNSEYSLDTSTIFQYVENEILQISENDIKSCNKSFQLRQAHFISRFFDVIDASAKNGIFIAGADHIFSKESNKKHPVLEKMLDLSLQEDFLESGYFAMSPVIKIDGHAKQDDILDVFMSKEKFDEYIISYRCLILLNMISFCKEKIQL